MQAATGTISAGHDDTQVGIDSQLAQAKYKEGDYENDTQYSSYTDTITVQRIRDDEGGRQFTDVFKGKSNKSNVIITEDIVGVNGGNLEIQSQEYYNYVQFDAKFTDAVNKAFYDNGTAKRFQVTFDDQSSGGLNFSAASGNGINLDAIDIKKIADSISNSGNTTAINEINYNPAAEDKTQGYNSFDKNISLNSNELFEKFLKAEYDQRKEDITTYNTKIDSYRNELSTIYAKTTTGSTAQLTTADRDRWNSIKNELEADYNRLSSFQKAYTDFPIDTDSNLNSVLEYTIRHFCKKGSTALDAGDHYKLIALQSANGQGTVYVPKNIDDRVPNEFKDAKGYMASGQVTVIGVASSNGSQNSFKGTKLTGLTIPATVRFIGKEAFANSNLLNVTIYVNACEIIGEEAFSDCSSLNKVDFIGTANSFTIIDKKAFANTAIGSVTIPSSIGTVGAGAFENIPTLKEVKFSAPGNTDGIDIEPYAFFNCTGLGKVEFADSDRQYKIKRGAFALASQGGEAMGSFVFPTNNTAINYGISSYEEKYDFILANRTGLKSVTFPGKLEKNNVPDNTLAGLGSNIEYVKFPEDARAATYKPDQLFKDIYNPNFYVEGPESNGTGVGEGGYSSPRKITWEATAGELGNNSWSILSVPYKFTDSKGLEHFEIGVIDEVGKPPKYIANIEKINESEAKLVSYFPYDANADVEDYVWIKIPTTVGPYKVVSIEQGCFDNAAKLKEKVSRLTIGDSVTEIKEGAFKEMPALQWVDIGSAVVNIGSQAFAECKELENVVFSQVNTSTWNDDNVEYWQELKIADDAFKTNSKRLTFHGAVNPNYAPFRLAMSANNSDMLSTDAQICYKTDEPLNLTIIRNRKDGKATLVDYPHYEEMDANDKSLFESIYISGTETDQSKLDTDAGKKILQTLKMELPSGIESIDTKSFFAADSGNNPDFDYVDYHYKHYYGPAGAGTSDGKSNHVWESRPDRGIETLESSKKDIKKLYSEDAYAEDKNYAENIGDTAYVKNDPENDMIVSTGGLFSGGFKEAKNNIDTKSAIWSAPYENHTYMETYPSGNDYLTSINMRSVKELPKYAFDSCENLLTVAFNAVESMGDLPFRGCKNLYSVNTGNSKFAFENLLLYEKNDDGSTEIVECLEGRGKGYEDNGQYYYTGSITGTGEDGASNVDTMISTVTSIREGAFSNCEDITLVDLDASRVDHIPQRAFENCTNLDEVILPETLRAIDQKAFKGAADGNLKVTIKNPDCTIAVDAFDFKTTKEVFIKGISTNYKGEESTCHLNYEQIKKELEKSGIDGNRIHWSELGSTCILTFEDEIGNIIDTIEIDKGATLKNPPTAPNKTGFKFDYWICTGVRDENGNPLTGEATYSNVTEDRTIRAIYKEDPSSIVPDGKDYNLTVANGKAMINGTLISTFPTTVKGGTSVTIMANDETNFKVWTIEPLTQISLLLNPSSPATSFTMPNADITVTANAAIGGGTDTPNPDGTYTVTVNNGTGGGNYRPGATVTITANAAPTGQTFVNWTTTTSGVTLANANTATTTFVMPSSNVTVTANYSGGNQGGNNPGDGTNKPGDDANKKKYKVTVNYGSGSGEYAAGETVNITANAPESSSRVFSRWTTNNSGLGFANANSVSTSFVMPAADVTVTANYRTRTDDDDDDDGSSRRPGTNTNTNTVTNRPGSSTSTTGTNGTVNNPANGTTNNNGNKIYITKNGISNTDVASMSVSGSTDNFIVRITESPEATAQVEQALTNAYGSLNGLAYLPMDISLYDSTGQNKITDTTGLNITVTMPIPDVLIQYGG
ncbi:MAG: leucine-rich repeat protein, partial [Lachnospiraceae bacterium]|nr:leucine-rich repeat protein [Lachnospiraceae bacterium]